ncbi:hypothetical protein DSL72_008781 [Monilinia vaccinii-corymbosi]|uniref:Uncharacterized protein n=1 Tax=Monilinia vaccinii-corymbosi TaxID=61207 RepID=A0A8A3PQ71_9HELO|nr:hypothetical protein DSL72_008781 [Monilinia vaccinii-corymbosi]
MCISRPFRSRHLRVAVQQNRSLQLATTTCRLALRQRRSMLHSSASSASTTAPAAQTTATTPSYIYTEVGIGKLCDTLWMENNVMGYTGVKRADILKTILEEGGGEGKIRKKDEKKGEVSSDDTKDV